MNDTAEARLVKSYKYISVYKATQRKDRKTGFYRIVNTKSGEQIADLKWWSHWRQYCLMPSPYTIWSAGCLDDIQDFLKDLKDERKNGPYLIGKDKNGQN